MRRKNCTALVCLAAVLSLAGCAPGGPPSMPRVEATFNWRDLDSALWAGMLAAEDARVSTEEELTPILMGTESPSAETRQLAVRALGRLEHGALVPLILPLLSDSDANVRAEAANALGQAVFSDAPGPVVAPLVAQLGEETNPYVRGVVAQTLGRLSYGSLDTVRLVEAALIDASHDSAPASLIGVARGMESLVRRQGDDVTPSLEALERLRALAVYRSTEGADEATQIRRLAVAALIRSGRVDVGFLEATLNDVDPEVRRLTAAAVLSLDTLGGRAQLVSRALGDDDGSVRHDALRASGRRLQRDVGCERVLGVVDDPDPDVALLAIDLLGSGCGASRAAADRLQSIAEELPPCDTDVGSHTYPAS